MTLNEIGKLAGVSRMTVSRYFNGGYVSEDAKKRIEEIVKETGFRPNAQARAFRTQKSQMIGLLVPSLDNPLVMSMSSELIARFEEISYQTIVMRYFDSSKLFMENISQLISRGGDGLIVFLTIYDKEIEKKLQDCPIPVVTIGPYAMERVMGVVHDDAYGFQIMVEKLISRGYTKIGCFSPNRGISMSNIREEAIQNTMQKNRIMVNQNWILHHSNKEPFMKLGSIFASELLDMQDRPEVVYYNNM